MKPDSNIILNEIIRRHGEYIKYVISLFFKQKEDREDMYQEMMIHLMGKIDGFHSQGNYHANLKSWLGVVVKNRCLDILSRNRNEFLKMEDIMESQRQEDQVINDDPGGILKIFQTTKTIDIEEMLMKLSERDRQLIILRYFKKYSITKIDKALGLTNSAVYIKRAIAKLKDIVGADRFNVVFDGYEIE